jgi:hypothetical protein
MEVFRLVLPSNYVSQVQGPFYTLQFQAAAEAIAEIQISAQESFSDRAYVYTRPEFLWQMLGVLVFPNGRSEGIPTIEGDLSYRDFLRQMVVLLLKGATKEAVEGGIELLTTADVEIIEKGVVRRQLGELSGYGPEDHFAFEINLSREVETVDEHGFPITLPAFPEEDIETLQQNIEIVLRALKPAHVLYSLRYLFRDVFQGTIEDTVSWEMASYYYDDLRKYCCGARDLEGTEGRTLTDRSLFADNTLSFHSVSIPAELVVLTGPNSINASATDEGTVGRYRVQEVLYFPYGDDPTARPYTTSGGLSGTATVLGGVVEDTNQDFGQASEGETLTFLNGPNAGTYRLDTLMGNDGGPVGISTGPATRVRVTLGILRIEGRMAEVATGQAYTVSIDRLGVQEPRIVEGEDVSEFFYL